MENWISIVAYGAIFSLIPSLIIFGILVYNPRLLLRSYPQEIKNAVPPQTPHERKQTVYVGLLFWLFLFGPPILYTLWIKEANGGVISFLSAFFHLFGTLMVFNLVDLLVLDWLFFCALTPRFVVIPGTEGMKEYKDYLFHFKGFVKGTFLLFIASLIISSLIVYL